MQKKLVTAARSTSITTASILLAAALAAIPLLAAAPTTNQSLVLGDFAQLPVQPAGTPTGTISTGFLAAASPPSQHLAAEAALAGYIASRWQVGIEFARRVVRMARSAADSHSLDPLLVLAVVARESSFQNTGNVGSRQAPVSVADVDPLWAHGLMQVAGRFHPDKMPTNSDGIMRVTTDDENLRIGSQILSEYLRRDGGDLTRALQRYNGNMTDIDRRFARYVLRVRAQLAQVVAAA